MAGLYQKFVMTLLLPESSCCSISIDYCVVVSATEIKCICVWFESFKK